MFKNAMDWKNFAIDRYMSRILRTHNANASEEREYSPFAMNHFFAIPTQLQDGVRALRICMIVEVNFCFVMVFAIWALNQQTNSSSRFWIFCLTIQMKCFSSIFKMRAMVAPKFFITGKSVHSRDSDLDSWPTLGEFDTEKKESLLFGSPTENDPLAVVQSRLVVFKWLVL